MLKLPRIKHFDFIGLRVAPWAGPGLLAEYAFLGWTGKNVLPVDGNIFYGFWMLFHCQPPGQMTVHFEVEPWRGRDGSWLYTKAKSFSIGAKNR